MPKITLMNGETGKLEDFEPIDAREILQTEGTAYTVPAETVAEIGGPTVATKLKDGASVPQLQGDDAEMQTGLSIDKYGREAVVKAQVGDPGRAINVDSKQPQTTTGRPIANQSPAARANEKLDAVHEKRKSKD